MVQIARRQLRSGGAHYGRIGDLGATNRRQLSPTPPKTERWLPAPTDTRSPLVRRPARPTSAPMRARTESIAHRPPVRLRPYSATAVRIGIGSNARPEELPCPPRLKQVAEASSPTGIVNKEASPTLSEEVQVLLNNMRCRLRGKTTVTDYFLLLSGKRGIGAISYDEFARGIQMAFPGTRPEVMQGAAEMLDKERQGTVTLASMGHWLTDVDLEDGLTEGEMPGSFAVVCGRREYPERPRNPALNDGGGGEGFPEAPPALRDAARAYATQQAWGAWGGAKQPRPSTEGGPKPTVRSAQEEEEDAARKQQREQSKLRTKVQQALNLLRAQVDAKGSVAATFRKLDSGVKSDGKISAQEFKEAINKAGFAVDQPTVEALVQEFDMDGDGTVSYREFVAKMIGRLDIGGNVTGGADSKNVRVSSMEEKEARAAKVAGSQHLSAVERNAAVRGLDALRNQLLTKHQDLKAAFRHADESADSQLSYGELSQLIYETKPDLAPRARHICRLLDLNGDGFVSYEEFAKAMSAEGGKGAAYSRTKMLREREKRSVNMMHNGARGRFAATPVLSYGNQMWEVLGGIAGQPMHVPESERFSQTSQQRTPEWQVADRARAAAVREARLQLHAYHAKRLTALAASHQMRAEAHAERLHDSLHTQTKRWRLAVARENRMNLR